MKRSWLKYGAILLTSMSLSVACGNKKRIAKVNKGTNSPTAQSAGKVTVEQCQKNQGKILSADGTKCITGAECTGKVEAGRCVPNQAPVNTANVPGPQSRPENAGITQQACSANPLVKWDNGKCVCANSGLEIRQISEADKCRAPGVTVESATTQALAALNKANAAGRVEAPASYTAAVDGLLKAGARANTAETLKVLGMDLKVQHAPMGNSLSLLYGRAVLSNGGSERLEVAWEGKNIDTSSNTPVTIASKEALVVKAQCAAAKCEKFVILFELNQGGKVQRLAKFGSVPSGHDGETKLFDNQELTQAVPSVRSVQ